MDTKNLYSSTHIPFIIIIIIIFFFLRTLAQILPLLLKPIAFREFHNSTSKSGKKYVYIFIYTLYNIRVTIVNVILRPASNDYVVLRMWKNWKNSDLFFRVRAFKSMARKKHKMIDFYTSRVNTKLTFSFEILDDQIGVYNKTRARYRLYRQNKKIK